MGEIHPLPLIQTSPGLGSLAAALAKAQAAYKTVARSKEVTVTSRRTGAKYTFSYAPLEAVIDATTPALSANGLSVTQELSGVEVKLCTTTLMHESGEWRSSTFSLPGSPTADAQEFGSQVTYARRYALQCVLGVAAEEDDDANAADGNAVEPKGRKRMVTQPPAQELRVVPKLDPKVQQRIKILQREAGIEDEEWRQKLASYYKDPFGRPITSSTQLSPEQAQDLLLKLEARIAFMGQAAPQGERPSPKNT